MRQLAVLPRGASLPSEAEMISSFGASRGSVREALRILEVQGLITIRPGPGGGPVLVGPQSSSLGRTEALFFHLLQARYTHLLRAQAALEPLMARLAAANPDRDAVRSLEQFTAIGTDEINPFTYPDCASAFHTALIAASGNPALALICQSLCDISRAHISAHGGLHSGPADRRATFDDHAAIASAVLAGSAATAEARMTAHMEVVYSRVLAAGNGLIEEIVDWH
ncbi:HTH gntR-type domain-containing protein [Frankia sp. AiPs1]